MHPASPQPPTRRSFLEYVVHGLGAVFAAVLSMPVVAYLIDPGNRPARDSAFKTVAKLSDLPVGKPVPAVIRDTKRDAWTLYPNELIGRIWLIRREDDKVDAFTTICPHLGCSVNLVGERFICPCHNGTFQLSGKRVVPEDPGVHNPAPRDMDSLEVQRDPNDADLIQVKYESFYQNRPEKVVKT